MGLIVTETDQDRMAPSPTVSFAVMDFGLTAGPRHLLDSVAIIIAEGVRIVTRRRHQLPSNMRAHRRFSCRSKFAITRR